MLRFKMNVLTVPHVGVLERDFVVIPLLDLDANFKRQRTSFKTLAIA